MSMSFFVEMAWKSSLIAGVALLLAALLKSRSAADRAAILQVGVALLLALPFVSMFLPSLQIEMTAAADEAQPFVSSLLLAQEAAALAAAEPIPQIASAAAAEPANDPTSLLILLYAGGLLAFGTRLGAGLLTLRRWTSAAQPVSCPRWTEALDRVSAEAGVAPLSLRVSADAPAPLSWGWRKPVILVDSQAYRRAEDAEAILAHEVAHVARRDWPALMLARVATAFFWFNPLVWLLDRAIVRHSEEAADCRAVSHVEPTHYAQALLGCAHHIAGSPMPANSIASSDLAHRVKAVLEGRGRGIPSGSWLTLAAVAGCVGVAGPVGALELIPAAVAKAAPLAEKAAAAIRIELPAPGTVAAPAPVAPQVTSAASSAPVEAPVAAVAPATSVAPLAAVGAVAAAAPAAPVAPAAPIAPAAAAIAVQAHSGLTDAEREELGRAQEELKEASREAARAGERAGRLGRRVSELAHKQMARDMARGADDMERGAIDMDRGAREMAQEAIKLRDPAYREKQIAENARRGDVTTHQELIDAIPKLEKGSRNMIQGAENMRRGAENMRRSAQR
jgi:beta-lactamase regulating signal transducer with metallopeptidase domain